MGDQFTWRIASGAWTLAADWTDVTAGADPAAVPPGAQDTATIAGPADRATYFDVSGGGTAAEFINTGNVALSGGTYAFGAVSIGSTATPAFLDIIAGTTVDVTNGPTMPNPVQVTGAGAVLTIGGTTTINAGYPPTALNVSNHASASLAGVALRGFSTISVDPTGTIEIGTGGGAAAEGGAITVDAGATVVGAGAVLTDNAFDGALVDNGSIVIGGGSAQSFLEITGTVTGTGTLTAGLNGTIDFLAGDIAAVSFNAANADVNFTGGEQTGIISGFAPGDSIGVTGVAFDMASFDPGGTLTLSNNGSTVANLTLMGSYPTSNTFVTVNDGYGDDAVVLAAGFPGVGGSQPSTGTGGSDNFAWRVASGGDWGTPGNWLDNGSAASVVPGVNDAVTFASASTEFQVVRGQGNSRSISITGDYVLGGAFATGAFGVGTASISANVVVVAGASVSATSLGVPFFSSVLNVNGAGATVSVTGALSAEGGVVVTGQGKLTAASATLNAFGEGISVDPTGIVDIGGTGGTAGFLTVETAAVISGYGDLTAAIINNGTIRANGLMAIVGAVTGSGTLLIAGTSQFVLDGSVAATETIAFGAASGSISVAGVLPSGGISGFAVGDVISFTTLVFNSLSYAANGGGGTLTLLENGGSVGALNFLGAQPAGTAFIVLPGSVDAIALADGTPSAGASPPVAGTGSNDTYQWVSTSGGDWGNAGNWSDSSAGTTSTAPGSNDTVTISGSNGYFQVVSGQGDSASLSISGEFVLGGIFQTGSFTTGGASTVEIPAAATLMAGGGTIGSRLFDVVGAGALMTTTGPLLFNNFGSVYVAGGGTLIAAGLAAVSFTYLNVDAASAVEVGTAGDPVTGDIVIDSGATVTGGVAFNSTLIDNGVIITGTSGITQLNAPVIGNGTIEIADGGQLFISSSVAPGITIEFLGASGQLTIDTGGGEIIAAALPTGATGAVQPAPGINAQILGYRPGDILEVQGSTIDTAVFSPSGPNAGTLVLGDNGLQSYALNLVGDYANEQFAVQPPNFGSQGVLMSVACFAAGTKLLTARGEIPVEQLRVGETILAGGAGAAPIRWIGHRRVDCRRHPAPRSVWPVRIRMGACGGGVPHRDLLLSPDHAVLVNGVLIPARLLINGATVEQMPVDTVTYYHVELNQHDVLLAEGMPVESYLDTNDRSDFANSPGAVALHPRFAAQVWEAEGCAPLVLTGPALTAARRRFEGGVEMGHETASALKADDTAAAHHMTAIGAMARG